MIYCTTILWKANSEWSILILLAEVKISTPQWKILKNESPAINKLLKVYNYY